MASKNSMEPNEKTAMFKASRVEEGLSPETNRDSVRVEEDEWDDEEYLHQISMRFGSDDGMDGSGIGPTRRRSGSTKSTGGFSAFSADESIKSWVQSELNELSDFASSPKEEATDNGIMTRTLHDVGSNGYGLQGVSVWLFDHDHDKLVPNGWWHNPSMPKSKALDRLFDPHKDGYVPQKPCMPGVDLAGLLWKESSGDDMAGKHNQDRRSSVFSGSVRSLQRSRSSIFDRIGSTIFQSRGPSIYESSKPRRQSSSLELFFPTIEEIAVDVLTWRDLKSLVDDPYTAKGPRLALLEEAGFCQAAGVTFKNEICQGIVIYYIDSGLDEGMLNSLANTSYLKQSTQMIGSCVSMVKTRRASVGQTIKMGLSQQRIIMKNDSLEDDMETKKQWSFTLVPQRIKKLKNKIRGGGMQIPPAPNMKHTIWTAFGAFCGLFAMSALNQYYQYLSHDELFLVLGPFGALMTLQYGLTAAPASQPRDAILGQAVAGAASLAFTHIPVSILPIWQRQAIAPAIAIGLMVKCGLTHPPAGAHAVILASGKYNWSIYGIALLSTFLTIFPATIINNLSNKRQYPTYWFDIPKWQKDFFKAIKELVSNKDQKGKRLSWQYEEI